MSEGPEDEHDDSMEEDPDSGPEVEPEPDPDEDLPPTRRGLFGALRRAAQDEIAKRADKRLPPF